MKNAHQRQTLGALQKPEGSSKNRDLGPRLVRFAQGVPEWCVDKQDPWRINFCGDLQQIRDRHGWNTGLLDDALNQSDGLMTHRSDRSKEDG